MEYSAILVFKVSPLIMTILLAVQLNPEIAVQIPISYTNQLFVFFTSLITALAFIEAHAYHVENRGRRGKWYSASGFTFAVVVSLLVGIGGLVIVGYMILYDYEYNDSIINTYISYYLMIGALMIFILSREDIFLHKAIVQRIKELAR